MGFPNALSFDNRAAGRDNEAIPEPTLIGEEETQK
jgi:hypothetical protein